MTYLFARLVAFCMPLALNVANLGAEPIRLQSTANQVGLLELYTSEGCSSCPPAESWLSALKSSPKLWRDVVPVAFHVDYWDSLGWKDPFASTRYSERQRQYANHWRSQSVYTPGFISSGKEWRGWSQHQVLPPTPSKRVGVLQALSDEGRVWRCEFHPEGSSAASSYEFHAALLGFGFVSDVKAGENRGRKLQHDFVVLKLTEALSRKEGEKFEASLDFGPGAGTAPRFGVAVWITLPNTLEPVQALGGWIPSKP